MALNDRERLFVDHYIKLGEAYPAALEAGYTKSTALNASKWINPEILKNPNEKERKKFKPEVRAAIDARMEEKEKQLIAYQDEILRYLTSVMRGGSSAHVLARDEVGADRVVEKPPDEKERLKAAELLGRRYSLFTDKMDIAGAIPVVISGGEELED